MITFGEPVDCIY